jgi:hypothetical protein
MELPGPQRRYLHVELGITLTATLLELAADIGVPLAVTCQFFQTRASLRRRPLLAAFASRRGSGEMGQVGKSWGRSAALVAVGWVIIFAVLIHGIRGAPP